jgi:zinc transport system ATP-binding protein
MPAIELESVTVRFPGQPQPALDGISWRLEQGQFATVIGPNGSGKSTLVRAILHLVAFEGVIRVFGRPVEEVYPQIGYVPQRIDLDANMPVTAREAIRMPLGSARGAQIEEAFTEAVASMNVAEFLDRPVGVLSGGQFKRVLIARALVTRPRLLLLDEPEGGIDIAGEENLYGVIGKMVADRGLTALVCTHELELVNRFSDSVLCLNRRLLCAGSPREMLTEETIARLYGPQTGLYYHHHDRPHRDHDSHPESHR